MAVREREKRNSTLNLHQHCFLHKRKNMPPNPQYPINKYKVTFQIKFRAVTKLLNLFQVPSFFSRKCKKEKKEIILFFFFINPNKKKNTFTFGIKNKAKQRCDLFEKTKSFLNNAKKNIANEGVFFFCRYVLSYVKKFEIYFFTSYLYLLM